MGGEFTHPQNGTIGFDPLTRGAPTPKWSIGFDPPPNGKCGQDGAPEFATPTNTLHDDCIVGCGSRIGTQQGLEK